MKVEIKLFEEKTKISSIPKEMTHMRGISNGMQLVDNKSRNKTQLEYSKINSL